MRGEKRPAASTQMVVLENGGQVLANGSGEPPIKKAAVDRLPEFDWAANNYELTWKLVEQLRKEEHRKVVFPEQEIPRNHPGDTKEDVYRRIAQTIVYEAFVQDPNVCASRMKNKTVAMWKDYSNHTRKLADVCQKNNYELFGNGLTEDSPEEVKELWKNICLMMPVYPTLRTFMPIRPEDKQRTMTPSSSKPKLRGPRASSIPETNGSTPRIVSVTMGTPGPSGIPAMSDNHHTPDVTMHDPPSSCTTVSVAPSAPLTIEEYLAIRKSYQEDVRLGIFSPAEAREKIEELDKARRVSVLNHNHAPSSAPGTPSSSHQSLHPPPPTPTPPIPQLPQNASVNEESSFEERVLELGFRKPSAASPFSRMSYKEFFRTLLQHSAECDLIECRLDTRRRPPRLDFIPGSQYAFQHPSVAHHGHFTNHIDTGLSSLPTPTSSGSSPVFGVTLAIITPSGPVPLSSHPPAASMRMSIRNSATVYGIAVGNLNSFVSHIRFPIAGVMAGQDCTTWDQVDAVVQASQQRRLGYEDIQVLHSRMESGPMFAREGTTLFDVICSEARNPRHAYLENGCISWS